MTKSELTLLEALVTFPMDSWNNLWVASLFKEGMLISRGDDDKREYYVVVSAFSHMLLVLQTVIVDAPDEDTSDEDTPDEDPPRIRARLEADVKLVKTLPVTSFDDFQCHDYELELITNGKGHWSDRYQLGVIPTTDLPFTTYATWTHCWLWSRGDLDNVLRSFGEKPAGSKLAKLRRVLTLWAIEADDIDTILGPLEKEAAKKAKARRKKKEKKKLEAGRGDKKPDNSSSSGGSGYSGSSSGSESSDDGSKVSASIHV